ncbi:MAG TPA: Maf family protein [Vicinamibacterales bacterium]|nr:Maf family protein [Vicinamibacterales bacterium]
MRLVLASASPRRRELLTAAGLEFDVDPAHVDETLRAGEAAADYIERVTRAKAEAARMLRELSGRSHEVWTGVAVWRAGEVRYALERTTVWMRTLSESDVRWYVASGEPLDKAGAYAIQGLASRFIPRIEGSRSNVVGLPVATVLQLLAAPGGSG